MQHRSKQLIVAVTGNNDFIRRQHNASIVCVSESIYQENLPTVYTVEMLQATGLTTDKQHRNKKYNWSCFAAYQLSY